jgi:DNA-binding GntR family transcriptional regulator
MNPISPQPMFSSRAAEEIREAILNGNLPPGSRIRQEELAARLGVSREPIRQALAVLEREGLVTNVNRGAIVAPYDIKMIEEIYEFRQAIESSIAGKVAARKDFDPLKLREIVMLGRKAVQDGLMDRLIDLDLDFHSELYRASQNRVVADVMQTQWGHIRRAMRMTLTIQNYRKQVWDEHEAILEAIVHGKVARARTLAAAHTRHAAVLQAHIVAPKEPQP